MTVSVLLAIVSVVLFVAGYVAGKTKNKVDDKVVVFLKDHVTEDVLAKVAALLKIKLK